MKNILIFYGSYGGGHLSAARSIYDSITSEHPDYNVEIFDCIEYINKFLNKVTTKFYSGVAKNAPKMWGKIYYNSNSGILSNVSNTANKVMAKKLFKLVNSFKPDLIISTHPFSSNMCSYLKKKAKIDCKLATIITDFALHNQWLNNIEFTDFVFVAHEQMRKELLDRGCKDNQVFTTGIPISPRFSANYIKNEVCKALDLSTDLPIALFFGGGEYGFGKNLTEHVFENLISNFTDIQVIAIAGKNEKLKVDFENIVKKYNRESSVKILGFTKQVPELMSVSDFVVSKSGGLTTSESLASGVPMFIISALPGQEEDNARFVENNGAGYWLKKHDDIKDCLNKFLSNLDSMKENCSKIGRKSSTNDICEKF